MKTLLYCLLGLLVTFSACEKDEGDACIECDEALHHMGDKMDNYACNPNYMQNAWDAINAECDRGNNMVGYMAETCVLGNTRVPACGEVLSTANIQDEVLFKISYTASSINDTIRVKFYNQTLELVDVGLDANQTVSVPYPSLIQEGDEMIVNFGAYGHYEQEIKKFSFNRPDKWNVLRTMNITRDPQSNELKIEFVNW